MIFPQFSASTRDHPRRAPRVASAILSSARDCAGRARCAPTMERLLGRADGEVDVGGVGDRHLGKGLAGRWVDAVRRTCRFWARPTRPRMKLARRRISPLATPASLRRQATLPDSKGFATGRAGIGPRGQKLTLSGVNAATLLLSAATSPFGDLKQGTPNASNQSKTTESIWWIAKPGARQLSPVTLDALDRKIIIACSRDGRRPYGAIAEEVGLSEAAVRRRVQRLRDSGVMQIVAITDPLQLGYGREALDRHPRPR